MEFRTIVNIPRSEKTIEPDSKIMLLGSCFAENIGKKFRDFKFNADINPFGIQYNPLSIDKSLNRLINNDLIKNDDLFCLENCWHNFDYHSSFSSASKEEALHKMNERLILSAKNLEQADILLITFGTAWIYEVAETRKIVSNCHKLPEKSFVRRCISIKEIVDTYCKLIDKLHSINENLQIIFTVSPIRHWKDGAHENNLSKSTLLLSINELQKQFDFVTYFPAYEILMDELRDYRFYASDMLHPNQTAIDYIWERFSDCYFTSATKQFIANVEELNKAISHRPFDSKSENYIEFCHQQQIKIEKLKESYPFINFTTEENFFKNNL